MSGTMALAQDFSIKRTVDASAAANTPSLQFAAENVIVINAVFDASFRTIATPGEQYVAFSVFGSASETSREIR